MVATVRRATDDDLAEIVALDFRNFGNTPSPGDEEVAGELLDLDRFVVATDGGRIVALGGSFGLELTVPGRATVPCSGVTWVSVVATHRRQGLLTQMMAELDRMAADGGEAVLGLMASEGSIYERFGYGIATRNRVIELDRRRAQIDPALRPEPVRLVYAGDHVAEMMALFDRYRLTQPGEVSRSEALFRDQNLRRNTQDFAALHPDGYAIWEVEPDWHNGHPAHVLTIKDLIAITPEANVALWNVLLSVDLVGPIRSIRAVSHDDSLPYNLTDQRALRTVEANDYLWLKVLDPVRCFGARSYRADDRVVIGVVDDRRAPGIDEAEPTVVFAVDPEGCGVVDQPVELVATRAALGPMLVGVSASQLAAGGRVAGSDKVLQRADVLLGTGRLAHCRTAF